NPGHVGTAAPDGHGSPRRSGLLTRRHTLSGGKIAGLSPWVKTDWNGVALAPIAQETGMATVRTRPAPARPFPVERPLKGKHLVPILRTTDHKQIGVLYLITAFAFFVLGGALALLIRGELASPGLQFLSQEQYNQLFTMHGTIMLLLFATPIVFGFANVILPLQIGAPDVAFPRLNAFSYWLFLFGGLIVVSGFLMPGGVADFGWTAYPPLSSDVHSPGLGGDVWVAGLVVSGLGTILGAVNMITTVVCLRAPGM